MADDRKGTQDGKAKEKNKQVVVFEEPLPVPSSALFVTTTSHIWLLVWLSCAGAIQGAVVNGMVKTVITSIEKRFGLTSRQSGMVSAMYDVGFTVAVIPVACLGGRPEASKPRWISAGVFLIAIGSFTFALPHFITQAAHLTTMTNDFSRPDLCDPLKNATLSSRDLPGSSDNFLNRRPFYILLLGQFLHGTGAAPMFTLGVSYLEENIGPKKSALFVGIFYAAAILGTTLGFLLNYFFLDIYVDWKVDPASLSLTPSSSSWVGAWWLGFLVTGTLCLFLGIPFLTFSRSLNNNRIPPGLGSFQELMWAFASLFSNAPFFFLTLSGGSEGMIISGLSTFLPKYFQNQFTFSSSDASIIVGAVLIPAAAIGCWLSSYLVSRGYISGRGIPRMCALTSMTALIICLGFLLQCPEPPLNTIEESAACAANCSCNKGVFQPVVCFKHKGFRSPCYAGCQKIEEKTSFTNCKCDTEDQTSKIFDYSADCNDCNTTNPPNQLHDVNLREAEVDLQDTPEPGTCTLHTTLRDCRKLIPVLLGLAFFAITTTFMMGIPALTASIRCVDVDERAVALALQWFTIRLVGTIPGPVLFGHVVDRSCKEWDPGRPKSDVKACVYYENMKFSRYMVTLLVICKGLSVAFFMAAWRFYPKQHLLLPTPRASTADL